MVRPLNPGASSVPALGVCCTEGNEMGRNQNGCAFGGCSTRVVLLISRLVVRLTRLEEGEDLLCVRRKVRMLAPSLPDYAGYKYLICKGGGRFTCVRASATLQSTRLLVKDCPGPDSEFPSPASRALLRAQLSSSQYHC
jgi:hypothetical protein